MHQKLQAHSWGSLQQLASLSVDLLVQQGNMSVCRARVAVNPSTLCLQPVQGGDTSLHGVVRWKLLLSDAGVHSACRSSAPVQLQAMLVHAHSHLCTCKHMSGNMHGFADT